MGLIFFFFPLISPGFDFVFVLYGVFSYIDLGVRLLNDFPP